MAGTLGKFAPARKLHAEHFAFMRAYVQGLDMQDMWERYLAVEGSRSDLRVVRRTVAWLRDALAAAAHRHSRHGLARLVRIDLAKITSYDAPSLEEFSTSRGLEDFSQEEQLASYQEVYGAATVKETRTARLIRRQLDAIAWLEQMVSEEPHADDGVRAWMPPELAERLEAVGMFTLRQLAERINGVGRNWHAPIRGLGAGKAERIVLSLQTFEASTGLHIGKHVFHGYSVQDTESLRNVVQAATAVVPLEKFIVPAHLDGSNGRYRAPLEHCELEARTDLEALISFLRHNQGRPTENSALVTKAGGLDFLYDLQPTSRAYRTECERFMLWAILERGKPLSSIDPEDAVAYSIFIKDPKPTARWCAPRSRRRWGPAWRPFEGPLSAAAQRRALTMLGTFYRFLVSRHYLLYSPWGEVKKPRVSLTEGITTRRFSAREWSLISEQIAVLPPTSANLRLRFALPLLYDSRVRPAELLRARVGDIHWTEMSAAPDAPAPAGWELSVLGDDGRYRSVTLSQRHIDSLDVYLAARGHRGGISDVSNADIYLLGRVTDLHKRAQWARPREVNPRLGIGAQTFYDQLKAFFAGLAQHLEKTDPKFATQLRRASTFWLRHTGISQSLAKGLPLELEMEAAGHGSIATTWRYSRIELSRRSNAIAAFGAIQRFLVQDTGQH